jgi:hypothetical protein
MNPKGLPRRVTDRKETDQGIIWEQGFVLDEPESDFRLLDLRQICLTQAGRIPSPSGTLQRYFVSVIVEKCPGKQRLELEVVVMSFVPEPRRVKV